jgi:hypothetical protein
MLRKIASNLALLTLSVVVTLAAVEIGLRVAHISHPSWLGYQRFYTSDAYTGLIPRPGAEFDWRLENTSFVRISSQGLHDVEHPKQKPANTFRIAVLGDSFTEALQVPMEKNFSSVLQQQLQGCAPLNGKRVEVLNFGVHGYGTAQELQMLRHYAWDYSPDLVLLAFFTGNDVQNNTRELQQDPYRPYFVRQGGKLLLDDSFLRAPGFQSQFDASHRLVSWAVDNSRVLQVVFVAKHALGARKNDDGTALFDPGDDEAVYHPPADANWREAWDVTEQLIETMNAEVKARGSQFLLTTLSTGVQVDPDPSGRAQLEKRYGLSNLFYPDERLHQFATQEQIPVLTLAPIFLQYAQEHQVELHGFHGVKNQGHWNELGHQLGGSLMARAVCEMQNAHPVKMDVAARGEAIPDRASVTGGQNRPVTP